MNAFDLARILWEARKREAWGSLADTMMSRNPFPSRPADAAHPMGAEHDLAFAQAKALLAVCDVTPKRNYETA